MSGKPATAPHGDDEQWAPISDLMAALMMVFMFIAILFVRSIVQADEASQSECDKLLISLQNEFKDDLQEWGAVLLSDTTARFHHPEILFENGETAIRPRFQSILASFFPRYIGVAQARDDRDEVREIRIEGHTSSAWAGAGSKDEAYFMNMALSQGRTRSILQLVLSLPMRPSLLRWAKPLITANGLSSSKLMLHPTSGAENEAKSRRVEFRLITSACQKAGVYDDHAGGA